MAGIAAAAAMLPQIALAQQAAPAETRALRQRLPQDEVIYFLLPDRFENGDPANDRGGISGDRMAHGFDPAHKGFYHGGDLKGLIQRLHYIQALGATAIWVAPIFKNKPVQGGPGQESAGYHGYWVTDFTQVDPHFGSNADFKALVDAAHGRGMKVYMDIIANHTADVIQYRECGDCAYRTRADYPYSRQGGVKGKAINPGFAGDQVMTAGNFARLTEPTWAYTPYVPQAERNVKVPAWLNDPIHYHNRGNTTFENESSTMGDFVGLDDLMTESPVVVQGMIDIFGSWIDRFGIDGFRIDTARHVNPEFWQKFVPAMRQRAKEKGIPNFHIFGEVALDGVNPGGLARFTHVDRYPAVLDFAFRSAVIESIAGKGGTDLFVRLLDGDALYAEGADILPTFTGNHDGGRFGHYVRKAFPKAGDAEVLARVELAHAFMFGLRGVPTIYSGDEQGFAGDGIDQDAREDMFPSKVAVYNDNRLIGTDKTTAASNFDTGHPLFRAFARLAAIRKDSAALRRGRTLVRAYGKEPGLFAVSRFDPDTGAETLLLFNTGTKPVSGNVEVDPATRGFTAKHGPCASVTAPGSAAYALPALGYAICEATK
ncbi:alpha-amylase family glycosyl hydrolase [Sphingomonas sp. FW199]|uniref:alpha-amylase family glycosyl hydrolase n=1 Tax=Sphingomonas sp. FW199 TaxID=3400217 RepID=UPI003CEF6333